MDNRKQGSRLIGRDGIVGKAASQLSPSPFVRPAVEKALRATESLVSSTVEGVVNRGRKGEPEGQSGLPRFNRYSIPAKARPGEVPCPYCVKRPIGAKGLRDHCRAVHPDKPEAR